MTLSAKAYAFVVVIDMAHFVHKLNSILYKVSGMSQMCSLQQ